MLVFVCRPVLVLLVVGWISLTDVQLVGCFSVKFSWHQQAVGRDSSLRMHTWQVRSVKHSIPSSCNFQSKLFSKTPRDDERDSVSEVLSNPGLWATDFVALILASQLIGLLDVINSPEFIENGGWFQPIPAVPSTLNDLVQRISSFGISWAMASFTIIVLSKTTSQISDLSASSDTNENNTFAILKNSNLQTLILFGVFQFLLQAIVSTSTSSIDFSNTGQVILLEVLRSCYYVGLSTFGLRYLYSQYFLL